MNKYIAIDIGGTAIKYGLIEEDAHIIEKIEKPTRAHLGGEHILEEVLSIIEDYIGTKDIKASGVAISTAGMVDPDKGEIFYASELIPNYIGINFTKAIKEKYNLPCYVENDVNCAGLCEYKIGAGIDSRVCLILTVGTGIGGCAIIDGKLYHGVSNSAFEVGYMKVKNDKFENLASAKTLVENVARLKNEPVSNFDGKKIFDLAKKGDELCINEIERMCENLAIGIANISYIINPDTVILGGGIMSQEDYLRPIIRKKMSENLVKVIDDNISLKFAKSKNAAGMLGAFYNFLDKNKVS